MVLYLNRIYHQYKDR
jgi:hypothetical protein